MDHNKCNIYFFKTYHNMNYLITLLLLFNFNEIRSNFAIVASCGIA